MQWNYRNVIDYNIGGHKSKTIGEIWGPLEAFFETEGV